MLYNITVPDIKMIYPPRSLTPFLSFLLTYLFAGVVYFFRRFIMETRVAVMSIIVEKKDSVEKLNSLLHSYGEYIIGRMGIPYRQRNISIISIAIDAPQNVIATLSGKVGQIEGVSVKTAYSGVISDGQ